MDLPLLRVLQAMKRVEDDPSNEFQTKIIDLASFTPTYPNIFIVDQSAESKDSSQLLHVVPVRRRAALPKLTARTISHAFSVIADLASRGKGKEGWTIILKEGLYINPKFVKRSNIPRYEVVGLKDVRLLYLGDASNHIHLDAVDVTLNNLRLYYLGQNKSPRN